MADIPSGAHAAGCQCIFCGIFVPWTEADFVQVIPLPKWGVPKTPYRVPSVAETEAFTDMPSVRGAFERTKRAAIAADQFEKCWSFAMRESPGNERRRRSVAYENGMPVVHVDAVGKMARQTAIEVLRSMIDLIEHCPAAVDELRFTHSTEEDGGQRYAIGFVSRELAGGSHG